MKKIIAVAIAGLVSIASLLAEGDAEVPETAAIEGYDPVAYFTLGEPTRGSAEFSYRYANRVWYFATADHQALFEGDPEFYMPWFGEYCANGLSDRHVIHANPEHWLVDEGRLFLFFSARGRRSWVNGDLDAEFRQATAYYSEVFGSDARPGDLAGYP